jgi:tetratricopeptide (TPR) repeat protein
MKASWLGLLCSMPLLAQGWGRSEATLPWLQGNFRQAERAFAQWRPIFRQALIWEAEFETERARFGQAETLLKEAKKTETPDSEGLADRRRSRLLLSVGRYSDALQMLLKGQRWDGKDVRKLKVSSVIDLITICEVYLAKGKFLEAIAILERARDQAKKVSSLDGPEWAQAVNDIAIANLALGQLPAASQAATLVLPPPRANGERQAFRPWMPSTPSVSYTWPNPSSRMLRPHCC